MKKIDSEKQIKGLGDVVEKVIHKVVPQPIIHALTGVENGECSPCKKRKEMLNNLVPFSSQEINDNSSEKDITNKQIPKQTFSWIGEESTSSTIEEE